MFFLFSALRYFHFFVKRFFFFCFISFCDFISHFLKFYFIFLVSFTDISRSSKIIAIYRYVSHTYIYIYTYTSYIDWVYSWVLRRFTIRITVHLPTLSWLKVMDMYLALRKKNLRYNAIKITKIFCDLIFTNIKM